MRKYLLACVVLLTVFRSPSQTPDKAAIQRIGDYGKLWYVLCLFHPEMAYGKVNADSLFSNHINELLEDPTAYNFKRAVQGMLNELHDSATSIAGNRASPDTIVLADRPFLKWLPDSVALFYFSSSFAEDAIRNPSNPSFQHFLDTLQHAQGLIIDLRNNTSITDGRRLYFEQAFIKQIAGIFSNNAISYPAGRNRIHYGHEDDLRNVRFYFQGWVLQNSSEIQRAKETISKPLCLLVNKNSKHVAREIITMQKEGIARVIADSNLGNFEPASTYKMLLADGVTVNIRLVESMYQDGTKSFIPDEVINRQSSLNDDTLIRAAVKWLHKKEKREQNTASKVQNVFTSEQINGYDSVSYPSPALRLMGLSRYWSIINYFCPNKDLITKNWDSVLYEYVPLFLNVKDSIEYSFIVARLIKEINDSHGFFRNRVFTSLYEMIPEIQLRYVEGKTIVYRIYNDSLKRYISKGDEVVSVEGIPAKRLRDSLAEFISASNAASLQRNVTERLLSGKAATSVTVGFKHAGKVIPLTLARKNRAYDLFMPNEGIVFKKITDKIGYVDMGRLEVSQLDSMFTAYQKTDFIILDYRSYPKGTIWSMINYLTNKSVTGAIGITMIADSPDPATTTRQESLWQIPVYPKPQLYKGAIIILVDEITQSQAEYSCMVLQAACKKVTIIGSQTAGADGDITYIKIPGGILTAFSGHGIHYPDGKRTQGVGIVPDIIAKPTITGIRTGKDEVLERAINFAKTGK